MSINLQPSCLFITARKRSLGQANLFTPICQSFCSGGGGLCMMSLPVWLPGPMVPSRGISVPGPMFLSGVSVNSLSRGVSVGRHPPPNQKSGRYASYWNAFLFMQFFGGKLRPVSVSRSTLVEAYVTMRPVSIYL